MLEFLGQCFVHLFAYDYQVQAGLIMSGSLRRKATRMWKKPHKRAAAGILPLKSTQRKNQIQKPYRASGNNSGPCSPKPTRRPLRGIFAAQNENLLGSPYFGLYPDPLLWTEIFVSSQTPYVAALPPNAIVVGAGAFER